MNQNLQARRVAARFIRKAYDSKDFSWGLDQLRAALGLLRDVATVWSLREGRGMSLADAYPAVAATLKTIQQISLPLLRQVQTLKQVKKTAVIHKPNYITPAIKTKINRVLYAEGLGGKGRFDSPSKGLWVAQEILDDYGVVFENLVDSHYFSFPLGAHRKGQIFIPIAFKDPTGSDALIPIKNAQLTYTFEELQQNRFEALAYIT